MSSGSRGPAPVGGVKLGEDAGDVALHHARADEGALGDFRIGQAQTDQAQHLALAPGQGDATGLAPEPDRQYGYR